LLTSLEGALAKADAAYAEVYDSSGQLVVRSGRDSPAIARAPDFTPPDKQPHPGDSVETNPNDVGRPMIENLGAAALGRAPFSYQTMPLFSSRETQGNKLAANSPTTAIKQQQESRAPAVTGYLRVAVDNRDAMVALMPGFLSFIATTGLLIALTALVGYLVIRRLTSPLTRLNDFATGLVAGRLDGEAKIDTVEELSAVAAALNTAVKQRDSMALESSAQQNLSVEWEERMAELARRNSELDDELREAAKARDSLWKLAYYDSLTALPNKQHFVDYLERALHTAQRNGDQVALLFLDLNNLKEVNDSFGRSMCDVLRKEVAQRLTGCVRDSDMVGLNVEPGSHFDISRFESDQFAILLSQVEKLESAGIVAKRIIEALAEPVLIEGQPVSISVSIGISLAPGDASDSKGLIRAADTAMYHAKKLGHSGISYYQNHMEEPRIDQIRLKRELREAVTRNELVLHYQPQVDIRNGTIVGAEALLRWNHPQQGFIPPLQFIPLAEEMDIITELGKWTLQETCRQLTEFELMGLKLPKVTINISALQFNSGYISTVKEVLDQSGIDPSRLQFELTEGAIITDVGGTIQTLQELKKLGVGLSIDDFGTGYSPLSYLSRFPLDELKIDRRFITRSQESETDANLVMGFIAMARCMKLRLVATGVETREQFDFLSANGVFILQGYLFSEPVGAEQLKPLLTPWHFMEQLMRLTKELDKTGELVNA
jgi:diguanylate cyclase (GGDEF)-like protein